MAKKSETKKAPKTMVKKTKPTKAKKSVTLENGDTKDSSNQVKAPLTHGKHYLAAKKQVDQAKLYSLTEALKLLTTVSYSKFNGSIETHLVVKETGLHGDVEFPHPTGKTLKIALADEATLKKIADNQIDFNVLLATPAQMPKLVKYARVLGPKGLMPNPKNGTVTADPDKTAKSLAGKTKFKTELKAPLIHQVIGKVQDKPELIQANLLAFIAAVNLANILKASLTPTMGPSIKLDLTTLK